MPRDVLIDETGNVYGGWTVIERVKNRVGKNAKWLCQCICGNKREILGSALRFGGTKSCGCLGRLATLAATRIEMIGNRYGRLVVIKKSEITKCGATWECKCDCGNTTTVIGKSLRRGLTRSCGCLHRELMSLPTSEAAFNSLVRYLKFSARKRGYEWGLSNKQVREITQRNCFYCDIEPRQEKVPTSDNGTYIYNGIDRVDNSMGYVIGNVVACCGQCNYSKRDMTVDGFKNWLTRAYEHLVKPA